MRRLSTIALVIVAIAIIIAVIMWKLPTLSSDPENPASGHPSENAAPTSAVIARPSDATLSHVAYVHDGDTLYLQPDGTTARSDEITVRLIGVDTPELRPTVECFAIEARDHVRALLPKGAAVWIKSDVEARDQYGRTLLYLWTQDGRSVNLDLVENGYATALRIAPSDTYWKQFDIAENEARTAHAGLWGSC